MPFTRLTGGVVAAFAILALSHSASSATTVPDADSLDAAIRARWAQAERFDIAWTAQSRGAVPSALSGRHVIERQRQRVDIEYQGTFAGAAVRSTLRADAESMWTGDTPHAVPADLTHAVLYGIARMGVLHNIANLIQGAPPEHGDGGIEQWLIGEGLRCDGIEYVRGVRCWVLQMDLRMEGTRVADTRAWYDAETLMPVRREVNVSVGKVRFNAIETYRTATIPRSGAHCCGDRR